MLFWIAFHLMIAALLACDFFLFQRQRAMSPKKAWLLSAFWILLALLFNMLVYLSCGKECGLAFFTAYLVEKSLSVDNLFVFLALFGYFRLRLELQRKVLFWGIIGAILFRALFILLGIQLLALLHWMVYVLGALLCFTGVKLLRRGGPEREVKGKEIKDNWIVKFASFLPVAKNTESSDFFVREQGRFKATTLFLALLTIEGTDILFALDSIPAVLAITTDPFIAYTSNIFAILGLRALYFAMAPLLEKFVYVNWGLAAILIFVGLKMLFSSVFTIPLGVSLLIIAGILVVTILCSWRHRQS